MAKENIPVILSFSECIIPQPYEPVQRSDDIMIEYGVTNKYPDFLLELYKSSSTHGSIINSKASYLFGGGIVDSSKKIIDFEVHPGESIQSLVHKCIKDFEIFMYYAVEVVYNSIGQPIQYRHVPAQYVRWNKNQSKFWVNEYWGEAGKSETYLRAVPLNPSTDARLFVFTGYFPGSKAYPTPGYAPTLKAISTDVAIGTFNLNNIKNHFSVSTLITFFRGSNLPDDTKRAIIKEIKDSYQGESGQKVIVDFTDMKGQAANVQNISPNDWDKAFNSTKEAVKDDIFIGHQVTNPSLFGVKTAGQLGGNNELEIAFEIFNSTYIFNRRNELLLSLAMLFAGNKAIQSFGPLSLLDKPPFTSRLTEPTKVLVYTVNELRAIDGMPPIDGGDVTIAAYNARTAPETSPGEPSPADDGTESGIDRVADRENVKRGDGSVLIQPNEADFEKIKDLGFSKKDYQVLKVAKVPLKFDRQSDISDYLLENQGSKKTISEAIAELKDKKGIDVTEGEISAALDALADAGMLEGQVTSSGEINVEPDIKITPGAVTVMYEYDKRPEAEGSTIIPTSRDFCRRLIENDKYYRRADIQKMTEIFGYDVFVHTGGFWHNKETGKVEAHCRHYWNMVTVVKKK